MTTARDIATETISKMTRLHKSYPTIQDMFDGIARQSGVSESMTRKFFYGARRNPSVDVLDKLAAAVEILVERRL